MAKTLNFKLGDALFQMSPTKVERKKLYGWTELRIVDQDGNPCRQAGLDGTGQIIIPKGAIKIGMLKDDGTWMEKSELEARHQDGTPAEPVPSSFDGEIALGEKASLNDYLDHNVTAVYQLDGEGAGELCSALGDDIYAFQFSYRGGFETSDAFLLSNGQAPFVVVGTKAQFEFLSLEQQAVLDDPDEESNEEEDELDFSMM